MDLLEHPLEAVAFRLYSLPIPEAASAATGAAAAWTCLAAVLAAAAAAGLWRMRSSTTAAAVSVSTKPLEMLDPSRTAEVSSSQRSTQPAAVSSSSTTAAAAASPKERYTAYYRDAGCCVGCCDDLGSDEDDEEVEEGDCDVAEEHGDRDVFVSDGADRFGWEAVVTSPLLRPLSLSPTTVSEMGTRRYRMRSPTATALSVVQLWDQAGAGGLTPTSSPRRRGRGVVVGAVSAF